MAIHIIGTPGHNHQAGIPPVRFSGPVCHVNIPLNTPVTWDYHAPEFASQLHFVGTFSGACSGPAEGTEDVLIPGLVELGPGSGYTLVGSNTAHPRNHFGATSVPQAVAAIAADYRLEFSTAPNLLINDISLEWGGLFDIDSNWAPDHITHRHGFHVDAQRSTVPESHRVRLEEIMRTHGARILVHATSYHLDFTSPNSPLYEKELVCDLADAHARDRSK